MSEEQKKKWAEIAREERDKGNVIYLCIDSVLSAPVKEIIKQPADSLLWDLNRDEVTALTLMDKEGMTHWVNNFAVALVIKELKRQLDEALVANAELQESANTMEDFLKSGGFVMQDWSVESLLTAEEEDDDN